MRSVHRAVLAIGSTLVMAAVGVPVLIAQTGAGQAKRYALESASGLRLHNVAAEPGVLEGKKGLRVTIALWIGPGTVAHFRDLSVSPLPAK